MQPEDSRMFLPREIDEKTASDPVSSVLVTAAHILAARNEYLVHLPVAEIVEILDHDIELWLEPDSSWLAAASQRIAAVTPYCEGMVRAGLRRLLETCRKDAMLNLLQAELGDLETLDAFRSRPDGRGLQRAVGPALTTHIFSGNVPGLPAISLIRGYLIKSANLGKPSSEEPVFPALFVRSIAAVDPKLAAATAIFPWEGGDTAVEAAAFATSEAVIAYGSDASIQQIRSRVPPGIRFVGHGHRISFAVVGHEVLAADSLPHLTEQIAYDVSLFDQQGCVSPHVIYVERGGVVPPEEFAQRLAEAMEAFDRAMPRGQLTIEDTSTIQQVRTEAELGELQGEPVRLFQSSSGTAWTVIYEEDPTFVPSCLNRVVRVKSVTDIKEVSRLVRPISRYLQTVGTAMAPERRDQLAEALAPLGVCRICPVGEMPHPPLDWHHDGGFSLLPLLRWTSIER